MRISGVEWVRSRWGSYKASGTSHEAVVQDDLEVIERSQLRVLVNALRQAEDMTRFIQKLPERAITTEDLDELRHLALGFELAAMGFREAGDCNEKLI